MFSAGNHDNSTLMRPIYIKLPEGYRDTSRQVGLLNKATYDLLWSEKFGAELEAKGFELSS